MSLKCMEILLLFVYLVLQFSLMKSEKMTLDGSFEHLKCWLCNMTANCIEMANISDIEQTTCELDQPFCKVQRYSNKDSVELFARGCASKCEPGCGFLPISKLQWCASCCSNSLCNTDKARADSQNENTDLLHISLIVGSIYTIKQCFV